MKISIIATLVLGSSIAGWPSAASPPTADPPSSAPATTIPTTSPETRSRAAGWGDRSWSDQHEDGRRFLRESEHPDGADLVLLGDSITQSFGGEGRRTGQPGRASLRRHLPGIVIANQGISGDRTQHLLWRLGNDALAGRRPAVISVLIGTNNVPHDEPEAIAAGTARILETIRTLAPESVILLHAIPPRGVEPDDPLRARVARTNELTRRLATTSTIRWIDPWKSLLDPEGRPIPGRLAADGVHLGRDGYDLWARVLAAELAGIEKERPRERSGPREHGDRPGRPPAAGSTR